MHVKPLKTYSREDYEDYLQSLTKGIKCENHDINNRIKNLRYELFNLPSNLDLVKLEKHYKERIFEVREILYDRWEVVDSLFKGEVPNAPPQFYLLSKLCKDESLLEPLTFLREIIHAEDYTLARAFIKKARFTNSIVNYDEWLSNLLEKKFPYSNQSIEPFDTFKEILSLIVNDELHDRQIWHRTCTNDKNLAINLISLLRDEEKRAFYLDVLNQPDDECFWSICSLL